MAASDAIRVELHANGAASPSGEQHQQTTTLKFTLQGSGGGRMSASSESTAQGNDNPHDGVWDVVVVLRTDDDGGGSKEVQMAVLAVKLAARPGASSESTAQEQVLRAKTWIYLDGALHQCEEIFESAREDGVCVVCLDQPAAITLMPCGHTSVCGQCIMRIGTSCPMCRQEYTSTLHRRN